MLRLAEHTVPVFFLIVLLALPCRAMGVSMENFLTTHGWSSAKVFGREGESTFSANAEWVFASTVSHKPIRHETEIQRECHKNALLVCDAVFLALRLKAGDETAARAAFRKILGLNAPFFQGLEFQTEAGNGFRVVHALPWRGKEKTARAVLASHDFSREYAVQIGLLARKRQQEKQYSDALRYWKELKGLHPLSPKENVMMGKAAFGAGNKEEAVAIAMASLNKISSFSAEETEGLGDLLFSLGKEKEAERAYEMALRKSGF